MTIVNKFNPAVTIKYLNTSIGMGRKQMTEIQNLISALDVVIHSSYSNGETRIAARKSRIDMLESSELLFDMDVEQNRQLQELTA